MGNRGAFIDSVGSDLQGASIRVTLFEYTPKIYGEKVKPDFFLFFKKSLKPKLSWKTVEGKIAFDGAEEKMYTEGYEVKIVLELAR